MFLPLGTVIKNRYNITGQVKVDGSTLVYMARDQENDMIVTVREFYSDKIMTRTDEDIMPIPGCGVQYKSLLSDFEELSRYLLALDGFQGVLHPIDVIEENGTIYRVEPAMELSTLDDYLAKRGAPMNWQQFKKASAPIILAIRHLHSDGFYHRGISPENILVNNKGEFFLTGFDIPAARTADSEIGATLYFGYTAPEQYSSASWQGSWSDVYSFASVCYRALTGVTAVEWQQRGSSIQLLPAATMQPDIPENVSNVLMTALSVNIRNRFRTIDELWTNLIHGPGDTVNIAISDLKAKSSALTLSYKVTYKTVLIVLGLFFVIVLVSFAMIDYIFRNYIGTVDEISSSSEVVSSEASSEISVEDDVPEEIDVEVPDFVGMSVERVLQDTIYTKHFNFEIGRVYSETHQVGVVVEQSPATGTPVTSPNPLVVLFISMGTEKETMPQVIGSPIEQASKLLSERSIVFQITDIEGPVEDVGTVISSSIENGETVYRTTDVVILEVVMLPEVDEVE